MTTSYPDVSDSSLGTRPYGADKARGRDHQSNHGFLLARNRIRVPIV